MGYRYHLHSHGRAPVVPLCRAGFVFGPGGGLVVSPRQDRQLVVQAVLMALWKRPTRTPVMLHSDRGCQFTSEEYQRFLDAQQVICSMSAVGSCADNTAAESIFGVLKRERVNRAWRVGLVVVFCHFGQLFQASFTLLHSERWL